MSAICKSPNILPIGGSSFRHVGPEAQTPSRNTGLYGKGARTNAREDAGDWLNPERRAFRNGTEEFAPLWDGPRLRPAFVAQLLGQAFPHADAPNPGLASAYDTYNSGRGMRCARIA